MYMYVCTRAVTVLITTYVLSLHKVLEWRLQQDIEGHLLIRTELLKEYEAILKKLSE